MVNWVNSGIYLAGTIVFTVYGQLVFKWQADKLPDVPPGFSGKAQYLFDVMTNLWILSSFAAAYVAALFWLAALRTMDLSYAYPFMALSFVLVLLLSALVFGESLTTAKVLGVILICAGVAISAQSQ
jgi:multidrug transporter EmrE-like cation transporter